MISVSMAELGCYFCPALIYGCLLGLLLLGRCLQRGCQFVLGRGDVCGSAW
jgi:hypothetical protein